jgi:integrase
MIRDFRKKQLEKGLAIGTANKHIRAIRSALSYAVREGIIPSNKLLGPHRLLLREEQEPPRILKVEDARALLNTATDLRLKTVLSLAYYHGLRRKEICYLRWENVDLKGNMLNITHTSTVRTKTRVSRSVFLRKETADLLFQLRKQNMSEFVFENPDSFYWLVGKWFDKLVNEIGLEHCTLHDFRKTCNTVMKENGVSLEAAMQVLGHSTIKVNQQCYTGVLTKQQKAAVNSLPSIG